ncbi:exosortase/archaeosortase family protein [Arthrobacter sp. GAS37]|uniref:archaeosortase/exosortase family protein n=1 Tax=Arthrobacter sp. GAS37 TaxID=3156261 RepID=UPI003838DEA0
MSIAINRRFAAPLTPISPALRTFRWLLGLGLLAGVAFLFVNATEFRTTEARVLASWLNPLINGGVRPHDTHFLVYLPGHQLIAFDITMECTALLLVSPLAVVSALMLMFTRVGSLRAICAFAVSAIVTFVINQLRLGLIAWTTQTWGMDFGYAIGHRFIGSLIALAAFALGFLILLWITLKPNKRSKARRSAGHRRQP